MIALVDIENTSIYLYTEAGLEVYSGNQISEFVSKYSGMSVMYITHAVDTVADDIASIFGNFNNIEIAESPPPQYPQKQGNYFLHSSTDKTMIIKIGEKNILDSNGISKTEDISVIFRGKSDCHPFDEATSSLIKNNPVIKSLIRRKQLEIIDEAEMRQVLKENAKKQKKRQDLQNKKDKALDSIIVKNSKSGSALDVVSGISDDDDDDEISRVDITDDVMKETKSIEDMDLDDLSPSNLDKIKSGGFA